MRIENAHVASNEESSEGFEDNLLVAHGISLLLTGVDGAISASVDPIGLVTTHPRRALATRLLEEAIADHRQSALRFRRGGLVLNYVPVLRQPPVFDPENVRDDHWTRLTVAREAPVEDHVVAVSDREGVLVPKRRGKGSHALEEPFATRADMSA